MAGRFTHFLIAGGAIVGGMIIQGDATALADGVEHELGPSSRTSDDAIDATVDRMIDREMAKVEIRDGESEVVDPARKRALMQAVADLVRAEGALISAKMDEDLPDEAIEQAEERRDAAKDAVERLADEARAESRGDRDALRQTIRDEVREEVRSAVRS